LDLSRAFASAATEGEKLPDLRVFEEKRGQLFRALELHETKLTSAISRLTQAERTPQLLERTRAATREHASLVAQITSLDNQIMTLIEREKQVVQEAISISRRHTALTHKFKSTWMPESGEEVDQKV
jgi:acyl-CoA reductase-like NAD-dependent aldehyde dehydrogenase